MDLYHRFDSQGPRFQRLLIDIRDLDLRKVEGVGQSRQVVGVTKHLCGAGTGQLPECTKGNQLLTNGISVIVLMWLVEYVQTMLCAACKDFPNTRTLEGKMAVLRVNKMIAMDINSLNKMVAMKGSKMAVMRSQM